MAETDPREKRAATSLPRFALLTGQLLVVVAACWRFQPSFLTLAVAVLGGFVVHYWLPFRLKEPFWFAYAIVAGAYVAGANGGVAAGDHLAAAKAMGLTVAAALVIFAVVASPLAYALRVGMVVAVFGVVLWLGERHRTALGIPTAFYRVFGSVFMFHILMYLYEAKRFKGRPSLRDYLRYFFMLPSFRLVLPFVDFQRIGQSRYARDIHVVAQQGILWIARGGVQYAVYVVASRHLWFAKDASDRRSLWILAVHLVCAYCKYLQISGLIHAFLGTMHLFGYDLPEGYRWYWLSHSPIDFWRRCNIYWKDAMMKLAYLPVYFALRKRSDSGAKIAAMLAAFVLSWIMHLWRISWLSGLKLSTWRVLLTWPTENAFWVLFGFAATVDLAIEIWREKRRPAAPARRMLPRALPASSVSGVARWVAEGRRYVLDRMGLPAGVHPVRAALQIGATWLLAASLFSLQHAPSIRAWLYTMRWWN